HGARLRSLAGRSATSSAAAAAAPTHLRIRGQRRERIVLPPPPISPLTARKESSHDRIFAAVRKIPRGKVSTYGAIARLAGLPRQARLVGYALHTLRADSTVPWHRVINAAGRIALGDESGSATTQRLPLVAEGVEVAVGGRISLKRIGWSVKRNHDP